jgi:hypothetical protein
MPSLLAKDLRRLKIALSRSLGGDLLAGSRNSHIAIPLERHSRFVMLVKVPSKDTETVVAGRDFNAYPHNFSPQVLQAKVLTQNGDHMQVWMRVRQHHVITVVMDTTYDIAFGHLDVKHGYSISQSTRIAEIASPGTSAERTLNSPEV